MTDDKKNQIELTLEILRKVLIDNHISMGCNKKNGTLMFFDTNTYIDEKRFDGFEVSFESLVK